MATIFPLELGFLFPFASSPLLLLFSSSPKLPHILLSSSPPSTPPPASRPYAAVLTTTATTPLLSCNTKSYPKILLLLTNTPDLHLLSSISPVGLFSFFSLVHKFAPQQSRLHQRPSSTTRTAIGQIRYLQSSATAISSGSDAGVTSLRLSFPHGQANLLHDRAKAFSAIAGITNQSSPSTVGHATSFLQPCRRPLLLRPPLQQIWSPTFCLSSRRPSSSSASPHRSCRRPLLLNHTMLPPMASSSADPLCRSCLPSVG